MFYHRIEDWYWIGAKLIDRDANEKIRNKCMSNEKSLCEVFAVWLEQNGVGETLNQKVCDVTSLWKKALQVLAEGQPSRAASALS